MIQAIHDILRFLGITVTYSFAVCCVVGICATLIRNAALAFVKERAMYFAALQQLEKDTQSQERMSELRKAYHDLSAAKASFMNEFRDLTKKHLEQVQTMIASSKGAN